MPKPVADGSVAGIVDRAQEPAIIIRRFRYPATGIRGFIRKSGSKSFRHFIAHCHHKALKFMSSEPVA
uniref:Uncharacterized protein n=1 Tax=Pluralibacter gergoviae TaxID=61647 RepID=A0A142I4V9_PLUGE|nr:hypothetical protein LG71_28445 [Pluralibacter gergoviae]